MKSLLIILALLAPGIIFAAESPQSKGDSSTPGSADRMPEDYWSAEHATGVIAMSVSGHIQAWIFISVDGKRMVVGAEHCAKVSKCAALIAGLMELNHADLVNYDADNCEEKKKRPEGL